MNTEKIIKSLHFKYPDRHIVAVPPDNPTEVICEVEPTREHPEYSVAVAVIERTAPHHHEVITETYEVMSGRLTLFLANDRERVIFPGQKQVIHPNTVHWAEADGAWVKVTSEPGWTEADHIPETATEANDG